MVKEAIVGVMIVGVLLNTESPVPVSSFRSASNCAEDVAEKKERLFELCATVASVTVPDEPETLPVKLPENVPVVVAGNVTPPTGKLRVHEPDVVIGEAPVTVIWLAVPANPILETVPEDVEIAVHVLDAVQVNSVWEVRL